MALLLMDRFYAELQRRPAASRGPARCPERPAHNDRPTMSPRRSSAGAPMIPRLSRRSAKLPSIPPEHLEHPALRRPDLVGALHADRQGRLELR